MSIKLFVACGGSGIKTIERVCELISEDREWRQKAQTDLYFLTVDTNIGDIQSFDEMFERRFGRLSEQITRKSIRLSENISDLAFPIQTYFTDPYSGKNLSSEAIARRDRLYQHWWVAGGVPEVPQLQERIDVGAGQCPPFSYFLTWRALDRIQQALKQIFDDMNTKQSHISINAPIEIYLVAGMAGGTGRGCWMPVAFALRNLLKKENRVPQIKAFFFDYSVLPDVYGDSDQTGIMKRMQVNSLTGWSELSCWVEQTQFADPNLRYQLNLPDMTLPGSNVLEVELDIRQQASPVSQVYMLFQSNTVARLAKSESFYNVAGNAIYARLRAGIQQSEINHDSKAYRNVASSTIEVRANALRVYFETQARIHLLESVFDPPVSTRSFDAEAKAKDFIRAAKLDLSETKRGRNNNTEDCFYRQAIDSLWESAAGDLRSDLQNHLLKGDHRKAANAVGDIQALGIKRSDLEHLWRGDAKLDETLRDAMKGGGLNGLLEVADCIKKRVEALLDNLAENVSDPRNIEDLQAELKKSASRTLVERFSGIGSYNKAETTAIIQTAKAQFEAVNDSAVLVFLKEKLGQLLQRLERAELNGGVLAKAGSAALDVLNSSIASEFEMGSQEEVMKELFSDPASPEDSLPAINDSDRFVCRVLKPALDKSMIMDILNNGDNLASDSKELQDTVTTVLFSDKYPPTARELKECLLNISHRGVTLNEKFVPKNFGLRRVIAGILNAWEKRIPYLRKNSDNFTAYELRFKNFFGLGLPKEGDDMPDVNDVILAMSLSLGNRCQPFWSKRAASETRVPTSVLLPRGIVTTTFETEQNGIKIVMPKVDEIGVDGNPFVIIAYASDGEQDIEQIASLDYYKPLTDELRELEISHIDEAAASKQREKRMGFPTPIYLQEPLRSYRWRPWADDSADAGMDSRVLDALDHALFEFPVGTEEIGDDLASRGWVFPLVKMGKNQWCQFTRHALANDGDEGKAEQVLSTPWTIQKNLCQGVQELQKTLAEKAEYLEAINTEREAFYAVLEHDCGKRTVNEIRKLRAAELDQKARALPSSDSETATLYERLRDHLQVKAKAKA